MSNPATTDIGYGLKELRITPRGRLPGPGGTRAPTHHSVRAPAGGAKVADTINPEWRDMPGTAHDVH
ncbi:hypothetical protein GCM10027269_83640 [Kribbella endophytica]